MITLKYGMKIFIPDRGEYTISQYREDDLDPNQSNKVRCVPIENYKHQETYYTLDLKLLIEKGYITIL